MPMSSVQKSALAQFVSFTQADKKVGERILKNNGWNVQQAVNAFFQDGNQVQGGAPTSGARGTSALSKMFDKYRDDPTNNPDVISITGTMKYFNDLAVSLDSISVLVVSELLQSPTMGELRRAGFITGWERLSAQTLAAQKTAIPQIVSTLSQPQSTMSNGTFRRVYKHTFKIALPAGQRAIPLDMAVEYWKLLFSAPGLDWQSKDGTAWLEPWCNFLVEKWKKAVNRDLWDQTLLFALKTMEDPTLDWWSEESAWPGVVDEFVASVKASRPSAQEDAMDVQ